MKAAVYQLDKLRVLIEAEKKSYLQAIKDNKPFAEAKIIYLKMKKHQKLLNTQMLNVDRS